MSWLFGKKEHPKHPLPEPVEEDISMDQCEGYEFVRKRPAPQPPPATQDATVYPSGNLYPYVPSVPDYSNASSTYLSKDHSQEEAAHYLSGIPFKLCKQLEISMNNDAETDRLRINEILSFVDRIDSRSYDYSFSVEESVIAEMNSRSNE